MLFENVDQIKVAGFTGFQNIRELWLDTSGVPPVKGVYLVLYTGMGPPEFVETGVAGPLRGGDPNVPLEQLEKCWVDDTPVLFIGKAGGSSRVTGKQSKENLRSRISKFVKVGRGEMVGRWGGHYIWQIRSAGDLVICWKKMYERDPLEVRDRMLRNFETVYHKRPFANQELVSVTGSGAL